MKEKQKFEYRNIRVRSETGQMLNILVGVEQAKSGRIVRPDEILSGLLKKELAAAAAERKNKNENT